MSKNEEIALFRFISGEQYCFSTSHVDYDTITAGYGKCNEYGMFEYPLPDYKIKELFGTNLWSEFCVCE